MGVGVGHNFGVQGGAGEHTQPCTHTHTPLPPIWLGYGSGSAGLPRCHDNCSIPAWQGQEISAIPTAASPGHGSGCRHRQHPCPQTQPPAQGAKGSTPSPQLSVRCYLRWFLGAMLLLIQTFLPIPPKATGLAAAGAEEVFAFQARICLFKTPPPHHCGQISPPTAKQQLLPAPALLGPSWQSIPLLDTRSPGYPQIPSVLPGGGTGWAAGSQIADPAPGVTPALRAAEPPGSLGLALPRTN